SHTSSHRAPSRRMRTISLSRRATRALSAFVIGDAVSLVLGHQVVNPLAVPVGQSGVVGERELRPARTVSAEGGGTPNAQFQPRLVGHRDALRVRVTTGRTLPALAELE